MTPHGKAQNYTHTQPLNSCSWVDHANTTVALLTDIFRRTRELSIPRCETRIASPFASVQPARHARADRPQRCAASLPFRSTVLWRGGVSSWREQFRISGGSGQAGTSEQLFIRVAKIFPGSVSSSGRSGPMIRLPASRSVRNAPSATRAFSLTASGSRTPRPCTRSMARSLATEYPRGVRYSSQGALRKGRTHLGADDRSLAALSARLVFLLSDGAVCGSLPSGEIEPSVMLASAPSGLVSRHRFDGSAKPVNRCRKVQVVVHSVGSLASGLRRACSFLLADDRLSPSGHTCERVEPSDRCHAFAWHHHLLSDRSGALSPPYAGDVVTGGVRDRGFRKGADGGSPAVSTECRSESNQRQSHQSRQNVPAVEGLRVGEPTRIGRLSWPALGRTSNVSERGVTGRRDAHLIHLCSPDWPVGPQINRAWRVEAGLRAPRAQDGSIRSCRRSERFPGTAAGGQVCLLNRSSSANFLQGRAARSAHVAHNHKVVSSNLTPATSFERRAA